MGGAPFAGAGGFVASVVGLPSRPPSTQAEPSSRGPGRQGRSYSGALHLDALNHARPKVCGSTADGMGAGASGGLSYLGACRGHFVQHASMQLDSIATVGPLLTAGAALIVGGVTRWTQRGVARDRIRWEGRLEVAKFDVSRFEITLQHFIEAANAGNRYMAALGDIDATDFKQREEYVFAILEPIGRARVESHALPDFPGVDEVKASIKRLEGLVRVPESHDDLFKIWDPKGIGDAIALLSKGRKAYMREVTQPEVSAWRRLMPRRRTAASSASRNELSSGAAASDISA